jgi:epoxyqueuosine reductase
MLDASEVKSVTRKLGIDAIGIGSPAPFTDFAKALRSRSDKGLAEIPFVDIDATLSPETHVDPNTFLNGARSIVSISIGYLREEVPERKGRFIGKVGRAFWWDALGELRTRRQLLLEYLERKGVNAVAPDAFPHRAAAMRSGVGSFGKNSNIQTLDHGSWNLITTIVTDLEMEADEPMGPRCGACRRCLGACPTKAIVEPYVVDPSRCISWLLASKGSIPLPVRELVGDRVVGCDFCQEVCPRNWYVIPRKGERSDISYLDLEGQCEPGHCHRPPFWGIWDTHMPDEERLRRNVAVALGNSGSQDAVPLLERMFADASPLVRGHAAWALGRLGGASSRSALSDRCRTERDEQVRWEIHQAQENLS